METSMYKEHILDIYEERLNFGRLNNKTHELKQKNPVCNDEIVLELEVSDGRIKDARFHGISCFISTISASVITEKIKGMKIQDALKLQKKDIDELLGIEIIPTRINCELLPLEALRKLNE